MRKYYTEKSLSYLLHIIIIVQVLCKKKKPLFFNVILNHTHQYNKSIEEHIENTSDRVVILLCT